MAVPPPATAGSQRPWPSPDPTAGTGRHGQQTPAEQQRESLFAGSPLQNHRRQINFLAQGNTRPPSPLRKQSPIQRRARLGRHAPATPPARAASITGCSRSLCLTLLLLQPARAAPAAAGASCDHLLCPTRAWTAASRATDAVSRPTAVESPEIQPGTVTGDGGHIPIHCCLRPCRTVTSCSRNHQH